MTLIYSAKPKHRCHPPVFDDLAEGSIWRCSVCERYWWVYETGPFWKLVHWWNMKLLSKIREYERGNNNGECSTGN